MEFPNGTVLIIEGMGVYQIDWYNFHNNTYIAWKTGSSDQVLLSVGELYQYMQIGNIRIIYP